MSKLINKPKHILLIIINGRDRLAITLLRSWHWSLSLKYVFFKHSRRRLCQYLTTMKLPRIHWLLHISLLNVATYDVGWLHRMSRLFSGCHNLVTCVHFGGSLLRYSISFMVVLLFEVIFLFFLLLLKFLFLFLLHVGFRSRLFCCPYLDYMNFIK